MYKHYMLQHIFNNYFFIIPNYLYICHLEHNKKIKILGFISQKWFLPPIFHGLIIQIWSENQHFGKSANKQENPPKMLKLLG